jgi:pimeloyl-[acyl-carrier protein] methyl ester esterase
MTSSGRLHVESLGAGVRLTLIHGWGMHGGVWSEAARELARHFCVHLIDLPGHGRSPRSAEFSLEHLVETVSRAAAPSTHVCGWSLGGMVALAWAKSAPEQVRSLTLVGTTPCFVTRRDWRRGVAPEDLRKFAEEVRLDARAALSQFASLQVPESRTALARLRMRLFERGEPAAAVLDAGLQLLAQTDLRPAVNEVSQRTLVLHGVADKVVPLAAARWLAEHLADARLQVFHGCGHAPFISKPNRFALALRDFIHER